MRKCIRRTFFCLTIAMFVWLVMLITGNEEAWEKINTAPKRFTGEMQSNLTGLLDEVAAEEYLRESLPKLHDLAGHCAEVIPENTKQKVLSGIRHAFSWEISPQTGELYPVLRTVFVVLYKKHCEEDELCCVF